MRIFYSIVLVLLLASCTSDSPTQETENSTEDVSLQTVIQGTWQTFQLNVAVNSVDGLDSFHSEFIDQRIWESKFGIKPPVHYFSANNDYRLERLSLAGEILEQSKGTWDTNGDTLIIVQGSDTIKYSVKHGNGKAGFRTKIDWDGDGKVDDEYQSILRQISIGTE